MALLISVQVPMLGDVFLVGVNAFTLQEAMSYTVGRRRSQQGALGILHLSSKNVGKGENRGCSGDGEGRQSRAGPDKDDSTAVLFA